MLLYNLRYSLCFFRIWEVFMIKFYLDNQRMIHKLIINQIAISALGLMVGFPIDALAYNMGLGEIPKLLAGIFTAAMYFFVIYDAYWEWGSKFISKKGENIPTVKRAFLSASFAYIPTFLIIAAYTLCLIIKNGAVNVFKWILILLLKGMHFGSITFTLGYVPKEYSDVVLLLIFILTSFLAIGVCTLGFKIGKSGKTIFAGYFHKKPNRDN